MQQISSIKDMKAIVRQNYLDKIAKHLGKDTIIIIVGQRRVGKSYTLRLFRDKVAEDAHANIRKTLFISLLTMQGKSFLPTA